jgi:sulfur carrier protein
MIQITLNGEPRSLDETKSVAALLEDLALGARRVAVLRNGEVVHRKDHGSTVLTSGDTVDVVHMVGGG